MSRTFDNYAILVANYEKYLAKAHDVANTFGGPSIYFHEKALEWQKKDFLGERHIEYIYATLVAWGMHRMGERGAKMPDFEPFKDSITKNAECLKAWRNLKIEDLSEQRLQELLPKLEEVTFSLYGSESESKVVSATKIMAHILPDLVCPMDRNYTLDFFNMSLTSEEAERRFFRVVMTKMWEFFQDQKVRDTIALGGCFFESYPKVFDNLIIAYKKL